MEEGENTTFENQSLWTYQKLNTIQNSFAILLSSFERLLGRNKSQVFLESEIFLQKEINVKKRNLVIQAAVAGLFATGAMSAYATGTGSANGNTASIAAQAVSSTSALGTGSIQYVETASIPVGTYEVYVQLGNGAKFLQSKGGTVTGGGGTVGTLQIVPSANVTVSNGTVSADQTFVVYQIATTAALAANTTTFTFKPTGTAAANGAVTNVTASSGTSLTATMSIGSSASLSTTLPQADEGTASSAPIVTFNNGLTEAAIASSAFPVKAPLSTVVTAVAETATIDVVASAGLKLINSTNTPSGSTGSELLDLGAFYFADVAAGVHGSTAGTIAPYDTDAIHTFNLFRDYGGGTVTGTLSAPAGFFNVASQKTPTGGTAGNVFFSTLPTCAGATITGTASTISTDGSTVTFSIPVANAAGTSTTFAEGNDGNANGAAVAYVCVKATTTNAVQWTAGQTYVTATLAPASTNPNVATLAPASVSLAKTALYKLASNGGTATVRSYIPAAFSATTNYWSYIRLINTGSVTASFSGAFVSDTTGLTGTQAVIASSIPAGGAATLTSTQIENAIVAAGGTAPVASSRPRLFVSAPTSLTVQSFFMSPTGNFNEVSSGDNGNTAFDQ